jgi:RimJ/RimL family protein N-acetyltransferase
MEFSSLTQADIDAMKDRSISRGILSKQPQEIDFSYVLRHEGKVLAIGGIRLINATTAWGWLDISKDAENHIIVVYRSIKEWTEILVEQKGIKRLQAYCECDFPQAIRTLEHLGFHQECIMPRFVGEKSAYLYVRHFGFDGD